MNLVQRYRKLSFWNKLAAWGALASITGLIFAVTIYFGEIFVNSSVHTTLQETLKGYLEEFDSIEANWSTEYRKVENVAGRAAAVLEDRFPQSSNRIRAILSNSLESKKVILQVRQEIQEVQDRIIVESSNN